jgi:SAM-dependent methyltransferase
MSLRKSLARLILGPRRIAARSAARMSRYPDRRLLVDRYLPAFAAAGGRILWVGCRDYCAGYPAILESRGAEVWTTELDPRQGEWGREGRHRVGDICDADRLFADLTFDAILCNGVLGWGVDAPKDRRRALAAMAAILRPGGRLLLGWNTDRMTDPLADGLAAPAFVPAAFAGLPVRAEVAGATHVYDLLVRIGGGPVEPR